MKKLPIIEFHILQSFPVSCLNRDDLGSPKSAIIGSVHASALSAGSALSAWHFTNQGFDLASARKK